MMRYYNKPSPDSFPDYQLERSLLPSLAGIGLSICERN